MRIKRLYLLLPLLAALCSCEVDFSPNADWKEVPVVYCVLDQDDSLSTVRVERCYLSEGDIYSGASVSDSFNYPEGSIQVAILAYNWGQLVDSIPFQYTTVDRESGDFLSEGQPIYTAVTKNRLRDGYTYELRIRRIADGSMLARATTNLLIKAQGNLLISPRQGAAFGFSLTRNCPIEWRAMQNGRMYQPIVRFYYVYKYLGMDTCYIDLPCNTRVCKPPYTTTYTIPYSRTAFLTALKEYFADDTNTKIYPELFDIYIYGCNEALYAYLHSESSASNIDESQAIYTNIEGGLGVFAARRTHLYSRVPGDPSDRPGIGLHNLLKDSIPGFI